MSSIKNIKSLLCIGLIVLSANLFSQLSKPQVYIFLYEECPISIYMTTYINEIQQKYGEKISLKYVYPNAMSNYKSIVTFNNKYGIKGGEILLDEDHIITSKLGATITPEAFVVMNDQVIYKGRINDGYASIGKRRNRPNNHDLDKAIQSTLGNHHPTPLSSWPNAIGCYISK